MCREQQNYNFSKYTYKYYSKRWFSITLIVVLDAYNQKDIIGWLNSATKRFLLLAKFEPPSWGWRKSRQNRPINSKIKQSVVICVFFLLCIFLIFISFDHLMTQKCGLNTKYVLRKDRSREHMFYSVLGMWRLKMASSAKCKQIKELRSNLFYH